MLPLERRSAVAMPRAEHRRKPAARRAVPEGEPEELDLPFPAGVDVNGTRGDERDARGLGMAWVAARDPERRELVPVDRIPGLEAKRIQPRARHPCEKLLEQRALLLGCALDLGHQTWPKSFVQTSGSPVP